MPANQGGPSAIPCATAKHTPGPWRWRGNAGEDYAALVSDVVGGPIIQTTHDVDPENPTAKLIAAAPALADALEAMCKWIGPPPVDRYSFDSQREDAWEASRAALRAAGRIP